MAEPQAGGDGAGRSARMAAAVAGKVWIVVAAVVVVAAGGAAFLLLRDDSDSPTEVLEKVQRTVAAEKSVRFSLRGRLETEEEEGESFLSRIRAKGEAQFPDRFRLVEGVEEYFTEVIGVGDTYYLREADDEDDLRKESGAASTCPRSWRGRG